MSGQYWLGCLKSRFYALQSKILCKIISNSSTLTDLNSSYPRSLLKTTLLHPIQGTHGYLRLGMSCKNLDSGVWYSTIRSSSWSYQLLSLTKTMSLWYNMILLGYSFLKSVESFYLAFLWRIPSSSRFKTKGSRFETTIIAEDPNFGLRGVEVFNGPSSNSLEGAIV